MITSLQNFKMKQIKVTFFHKCHLHAFKLSVSPININQTVNYKTLQKQLLNIIGQLVLSKEQEQIIRNLPINYVQSFVEEYKKCVNYRRSLNGEGESENDFLGDTQQNQFKFFQKRLTKAMQNQSPLSLSSSQSQQNSNYHQYNQNQKLTLKQYITFHQFMKRSFLSQNQSQRVNSELLVHLEMFLEETLNGNNNNSNSNSKKIHVHVHVQPTLQEKSNSNFNQLIKKQLKKQSEQIQSIITEQLNKYLSCLNRVLKLSLGYFYIMCAQLQSEQSEQSEQVKKSQPTKIKVQQNSAQISLFAQKNMFILVGIANSIIQQVLQRFQSLISLVNKVHADFASSQRSKHNNSSNSNRKCKQINQIVQKLMSYFNNLQNTQIKQFIQVTFNLTQTSKSPYSFNATKPTSGATKFTPSSSTESNLMIKIMETVSNITQINIKLKQLWSQLQQSLMQTQSLQQQNINNKQSVIPESNSNTSKQINKNGKFKNSLTSKNKSNENLKLNLLLVSPVGWLMQIFAASQQMQMEIMTVNSLEQQSNDKQKQKQKQKQKALNFLIKNVQHRLITNKRSHFQNILHKLIQLLQKSTNMNLISKIIKLFHFIYYQAIKDFSQLLFFITQTIRYDLPKIFKTIDQNIRERCYKLSQSQMLNLKDFAIFMNFYDFDDNFQFNKKFEHFEHAPNMLLKKQFQPFRLKQLIKSQKMKEDLFLKVCKSTLKDLKFLIQKYTQFKSGKIVHSDTKHNKNQIKANNQLQMQIQRKRMSSINQNYYEHFLDLQNLTVLAKGKQFFQVGVNVCMDTMNNAIKSRKNSVQQQVTRKKSMQFLNLINTVFQKEQQIHKLSEKIEQTHNQHNKNYEIIKSNNQTLIKIYEENSQLIKVNKWYQEQLRLHQDQQNKLQKTISQLIDINRKRDELKHKFKVFSLTVNEIIFPSQNPNKNDGLERVSKDSNRSRRRSSFNGRFLKDLTRLSPQNEKLIHDHILPALPPFTIPQNNFILPPPPPLFTSHSLPPPPPNLQITPHPLPPFLQLVPPPLLHDDLHKSFGKNSNKKKQSEFKTIGWNLVDLTKIKDSFWQQIGEIDFDKENLIKNFSKSSQSNVPVTTFNIVQEKKQKKTILKADRVKNVEIGLKKVRLTHSRINDLQTLLYQYNENFLQIETIECLLNVLPTVQQRQSYSEVVIQQETQEDWTLADYFLFTISKIESYEERLKAIKFKLEFGQMSSDFFRKINDLKDFLIDVRTDQFLQSFLEYMLNIGNFLNSNTHKGGAYGFRLQSIPKTYSLIGQDKSTSLFDFILKVISQKSPSSFNNLINQKNKMIVSLNILQQDLNSFIKDCALIQQIIIYSKIQGDNSSKYLLPFYINCQQEINIMNKILKQVKFIYQDVLTFYCQKMECEEMIRFFKQFRGKVKEYMRKNKIKLTNQ